MMKKLVAGCFAVGRAGYRAKRRRGRSVGRAALQRRRRRRSRQAYNWTGFYLGANGGGGWGRSWWSGTSTPVNFSGAQVGGTAGYNWQFGNTVLGLEGDMDWSNLKGTGTTGCVRRLQHQR